MSLNHVGVYGESRDFLLHSDFAFAAEIGIRLKSCTHENKHTQPCSTFSRAYCKRIWSCLDNCQRSLHISMTSMTSRINTSFT